MAMPRDFPDLPPVWALGAILAEWLAAGPRNERE